MRYVWHNWLNMERRDRSWHEKDIADETIEFQEAVRIIEKWSELSDIVYTIQRSRWGGHKIDHSLSRFRVIIGSIYMYPKYTSRFILFRRAGVESGAEKIVREVRNPKKSHKLYHIADKYSLDRQRFKKAVQKRLKYWPLLP